MKLLFAFFVSFSAFAYPFQGSFKAREVESNRNGAKVLYDLEVDYSISIKGDEIYTPILSDKNVIVQGLGPEQFEKTFFKRPSTSLMAYAQKLKIDTLHIIESSVGPGKKLLHLRADVFVVDPDKVNTAFEEAVIVSQKEIRIESFLTQLPLKLNICAAYDRIFSRRVKEIGCQSILQKDLKAGKIILDKIYYPTSASKRNILYFFHWGLEGHWLKGNNTSIPYVTFEQ
jgi:hypothetical protein